MVTGASSGTIPGQSPGDAVSLAHENAPGGQGKGSGRRNYQRRRRKKQRQKRGKKQVNERMLREIRMESRFHALEKSSERFAEELAGSLRVSERNFNMIEDLTKTATTMKQAMIELAGCAGEVRKEIGVERGRIDGLSGFMLPRLGNTSAKVDEVRTQMAEHREYCSTVLRELRGYVNAGIQHSRDMGVGGMQNVAAEGEDSDTGTADLDEMTAAMQGFQEEMRVLQETVDNIGAEVQWVAQGGESKAQNLQGEVEGVWDKIAELQRTAEELQGITGDLRGTVEGSELQMGATVVLHDLVKRADLNFQLGFLGVYDATKGRWAVELEGLTERMWVKGENLWAEDGMRAKIHLVEHILDEGKLGLL